MSENVPNDFDRVQVDKSSWAWLNIIGQSVGKALNATSAVFTGTVSAAAGTSAGHLVRRDQTNIDGPAFSAYLPTANQSVTSGVVTKVTLSAENFDTNSNFDSVTNYRFTPTVAGYYQINFGARGQGATMTGMVAELQLNGSLYRYSDYISGTTNVDIITRGSALLYFNGTTDYIELFVTISGTTTVIVFGNAYTYLEGILIKR